MIEKIFGIYLWVMLGVSSAALFIIYIVCIKNLLQPPQ